MWNYQSIIMHKDRLQIKLDGYTLIVLAERHHGRLSCTIRLHDEKHYLFPQCEAHIGILLYETLEELRREECNRFKLDLQVIDNGRVYDFVKDLLLLYKAQHPTSTTPGSIGDKPVFNFDVADNAPSTELVYWAEVYTQLPDIGYKPFPPALPSPGTTPSSKSLRSNPWKHPLVGRLGIKASGSRSSGTALFITSSASQCRKTMTSAYAFLSPSGADAMVWKVEQATRGGFRLRVWSPPKGCANMRGWYLGLVSKAKDQKRQVLQVVVHSDAKRSAVWDARWIEDRGASHIRLQWVDGTFRYLTQGDVLKKGKKNGISQPQSRGTPQAAESFLTIACAEDIKEPGLWQFSK